MKISEKADSELKVFFSKQENSGKSARVTISGFGCCGPKFGLVFDEPKNEKDEVVAKDGYEVIFEKRIAPFIEESVLDLKESWTGGTEFVVQSLAGGCCES